MDLALMLLAWTASLFLRPLRFQFLLRVLGHAPRAKYLEIWAATMFGMAVNSFTAMRAGDVVVTLLLRHRLGIEIHRSLTVIVVDAFCDFVCVSLLFLAGLSFAPVSAGWANRAAPALAAATLLALAAIVLVVTFRRALLGLVERIMKRLDASWSRRLQAIATDILASASEIGNWRVCLPLILFSALIWAVIGLSYWLGLRAVAIEPSIASASFTMAAIALSFVIPLGPGGLGAFEAAAVVSLSLFNVPLEAAIPFAIIAHAFQLGSALLIAGVAVTTRKIDYRALLSAAEKPNVKAEP
jgi:glycosyltransferase 2 family protein